MKMYGWVATGFVPLIAGLLLAAEESKTKAVQRERKRLAGTWQAVSYALDGKKASAADLKRIQLIIDPAGNTKAQRDGKTFIASTTKIDPTKNPRHIDIIFTGGP